MKIALAQQNYTVGDFELNKVKIIDCINEAKSKGADLVVFAEQSISGTPAYDLLRKTDFLDLCEESLIEIASYCDDISVLVGLPANINNNTSSVAAFIQNRKVMQYIGKHNVISRDEAGFISPAQGYGFIDIKGHRVAVVVGGDAYAEEEFGDKAETIVIMGSHPYSRGVIERRYNFLKKYSFKSGKNLVFVNHIGGQTDIVFDGTSCVFNGRGEAIACLNSFEEDFAVIDLDEEHNVIELKYQHHTANVYQAMKLGLRDYFSKNGFEKACLGLSGGIDSALVLAIAIDALGADRIKVLMMPSQFSSEHSVEDAKKMAEMHGVDYSVIPISQIYQSVNDTMKPILGGTKFDVTEENIQSRIRGTLIMALSNKHGYIVLNTSNKSENAVGYGTLYGDNIGAFSITGDLYKIEIYGLARYINRDKEVIPKNIIEKAPSAELRPNQFDLDSLPPYDILDAILLRMIELNQSREEISNAGFDADVVNRIYNLVRRSEYKRYQSCPNLRLSVRPFRTGRTMPLTNKYGM